MFLSDWTATTTAVFTPSAIVNETATNDRSHDKTIVGAAVDST